MGWRGRGVPTLRGQRRPLGGTRGEMSRVGRCVGRKRGGAGGWARVGERR